MADTDRPLLVGFHPPEQCVRGRTDCRSLAQIISSEEPYTFMCCGEVLNGATPDPLDQWCFCHRSKQDRSHCAGNDIRMFVDRRDMSHMAAVLSMGLAIAMPCDDEIQVKPPSKPGEPDRIPVYQMGQAEPVRYVEAAAPWIPSPRCKSGCMANLLKPELRCDGCPRAAEIAALEAKGVTVR